MNTASTASQNVRDAAKDARDGLREVKKAAGEASGDIAADLQALRDDFAKLAEQVGEILGTKGNAAWQKARSSVDDMVAGAQDTGREAVDAVREVSDNFVEAIDESIKTRPYTTLAIVAGSRIPVRRDVAALKPVGAVRRRRGIERAETAMFKSLMHDMVLAVQTRTGITASFIVWLDRRRAGGVDRLRVSLRCRL